MARQIAGGWQVAAPEPVGPPGTLLDRLRALACGEAVALGVDFPAGLPIAYVRRHPPPAANFVEFLRALPQQADFFSVAATLSEISAARPFYPLRGVAGMTRAAHATALGFDNAAELSRTCDRATDDRPAGAPLFWTLGANQVGKAALHAWRHFLIPALCAAPPARLWPFDGPLGALLGAGEVVIAETYPAEALRHLGLKLRGSKRRRSDRQALAPGIQTALTALNARADASLVDAIADGFGAAQSGEDQFDSLLGVLCVLNVLAGRRTDQAPAVSAIRLWEGWVLGQQAAGASGCRAS